MSSVFDASQYEHMMRKLNSCVHTLFTIADVLPELDENEIRDPDERADLLILAENLIDVASYITDTARDIAWLHTPVPEHEE